MSSFFDQKFSTRGTHITKLNGRRVYIHEEWASEQAKTTRGPGLCRFDAFLSRVTLDGRTSRLSSLAGYPFFTSPLLPPSLSLSLSFPISPSPTPAGPFFSSSFNSISSALLFFYSSFWSSEPGASRTVREWDSHFSTLRGYSPFSLTPFFAMPYSASSSLLRCAPWGAPTRSLSKSWWSDAAPSFFFVLVAFALVSLAAWDILQWKTVGRCCGRFSFYSDWPLKAINL